VRVATRDGEFDLHWGEREELLKLLGGGAASVGELDRVAA
jgi:hypothetical protein